MSEILSQYDDEEIFHSMIFFNKKMIFVECNYEIYDKKFLIIIRCVKLLLLKDWFANINWLELKLQFNMLIIQTNRCFIKNRIRDLLCIRRLSIEILNDYRISLINDLFVTFTVFETRIYEIFLITSFDAYIEVCSLESRHQCRAIAFPFLIWIVANRLFDSDLNRYIIFFQRNRSFMRFKDFSSFMTSSSLFIICLHVNRHVSNVEIALKCKAMKKKKKKANVEWFI